MQAPEPDRDDGLRRDNLRMVGKLAVVAALMFGFGYALVPMYRAICTALGINVLTVAELRGAENAPRAVNSQVDRSRTVPRDFDRIGPTWTWKPCPSAAALPS